MVDASETRIRESFRQQAGYCRALQSPFTAQLCDLLADGLTRETRTGARVLSWPGSPEATDDALALRVTAGLHALALKNIDANWSALYPPAASPDIAILARALDETLHRHDAALLPWLDLPPQTNEVGRSAALMSGLVFLAGQKELPFSLYELGSSGGLNLILDRYAYTLGTARVGGESAVHLTPAWSGPSPRPANVRVVARRGVDQAPIDVRTPFGRERLAAYVWPDQTERLKRVRAAIAIAAEHPPPLDGMDASDWIERTIALAPQAGIHRVLMHSVTFQYFSDEGKRRVTAHAERVGAHATTEAPFSWLRMEQINGPFELRVRTWPSGEDRLLALCHAHGATIDWKA
jgi:hypothetical protein